MTRHHEQVANSILPHTWMFLGQEAQNAIPGSSAAEALPEYLV